MMHKPTLSPSAVGRPPIAHQRITAFFDSMTDEHRDVAIVAVTHLLPDRPYLLDCLRKHYTLAAVYPKPKSVDEKTRSDLEHRGYPIATTNKDRFVDRSVRIELEQRVGDADKVILFDIGGYFAHFGADLDDLFDGRLIGVVEDTENGAQAYERGVLPHEVNVPIYTVARSPLKVTEDYLVGQAIQHSAEHLIRHAGQVLGGKTAVVIGFGKIGRSVAHNLRQRGVEVTVHDKDEIRQVEAMSLGYRHKERDKALQTSDLVVCATGNFGLKKDDWYTLKNGAFVFTVTSSDSELEIAPLLDPEQFSAEPIGNSPHVTMYSTKGRYFYLLNDGNAVNFLHNAVVGDYIYLVQGEIVRCADLIATQTSPGSSERRLIQLPDEDRRRVAREWLRTIGATS